MRAPALLLLLLLPALAPLPAAALPPDEKPFPACDRSVILREEKTVYLVEGRVRIPKGVEVSCQKDIHIRAKGGAPAVLEVEGSFEAHGVSTREVIFEGVTLELAETFGKVQIDSCIFRNGGGVVTAKDGASSGTLRFQFCRIQDGARLDLRMARESVEFVDSSVAGTARLVAADSGESPNRLRAVFRGSSFGSFRCENVADATVRLCTFDGTVAFKDVGVLSFDGNKVQGGELSFEHARAGRFAGTKVIRCDLYAKSIVFRAPKDPKKSDSVTMDKCWFEGERDPKAIAARIRDAADEEGNGVRVAVTNPQERPLEQAGAVNR